MIQRLGWALLHFLWQGSAIVILYALARRCARRPQTRYVLACGALAAMMVAPALTFFLTTDAAGHAAVWTISASEGQRVFPAVVALWAAGVVAFSIRLIGGWRFTVRLRATSHPAPAEWQERMERIAVRVGASAVRAKLVVSSLVCVPTVIGCLRPLILMPVESLTGMPAEHLAALLAHELAHIRRRDFLMSVLQNVAEALLFYHPAVWWVSDQIRAERELCCDDLAVAASDDVLTYARALAALEWARVSTLPAANGGSLAERIRRLVEPGESVNNLPGPAAAWAMALLWLAGVGVATVHGAQTPKAAPPSAVFEPLPTTLRPTPFPSVTFAERAKKTLAYDPVLIAQVQQTLEARDAVQEIPWKKWLDEDVTYIITDAERQAFRTLSTDEEREQFVEQFWLRRDPTPNTVENEFKEEQYRRIAYSNAHFGAVGPGWSSDRGRVYITFGPPDEIDSHPAGLGYERATEFWRYHMIQGIGSNVAIQFIDNGGNGDYRWSRDPAGLPAGPLAQLPSAPPVLKFKDLENAIGTASTSNTLPMMIRVDYMRVTDASVMTNITVQFDNRDLQFEASGGGQRSTVNLLGRVSTAARRPVSSFEKPLVIEVPTATIQQVAKQNSVYQESMPLAPGRYRLNIVAKDMVSGRMNVYEVGLEVPRFDAGKLAAGSLVLADTIEKLPARTMGNQMFTIGDTKVRPRLGNSFSPNETLGIYLQVYNFSSVNGSVQFEIDRDGVKDMAFSQTAGSADAEQLTIAKYLPLNTLEPGNYTLKINITDSNTGQTIARQGDFRITAE
jgi:GWxTD domain-containing protein